MGSECLTQCKVEDIALEMGDAPFGSNLKTSDYTDSGALVVQGKNIQGRRFDWSQTRYVTEEKYESIPRSQCFIGDLIFPKVGTIGKVGVLTPLEGVDHYLLSTNSMRLRVDPTKANHTFIYYYFTWQRTVNLIHAMNSKSVQPVFNYTSLKNFPLELPPLKTQNYIAQVLSGLDEKIEINRQTNQTLEQMAQALFKSWFVDFDPVIDNALAAGNEIPEALQPRADLRKKQLAKPDHQPLAKEILDLFPSEFEETSEMGWVPKGWGVKSVASAIEVNPTVKLPKGTVAKFADMKALPTSGYCVNEVISKAYSGGAKFQRSDVLLARITPCLENGKTALVDFLEEDEVGFGSTEFIVLRGGELIGSSYVACLARNEIFRNHCIQAMVGSSGRQRVQNSCFEDFYLAIPDKVNVFELFNSSTDSNFEKMTANQIESASLENLRDTLLPKLISGELRIPESADISDTISVGLKADLRGKGVAL